MAVTDGEYRALKYRIEQLERRVQTLENTKDFVSRDGTFTVYDNNGKPRIRLGKLSNGSYGMESIDAAGVAVDLDALAFGAETATVTTAQTTTSTSYTDLATAGPAVTVTVGPAGKAIVFIAAACRPGNPGPASANASFAVSGATTVAAADTSAITVGVTVGTPQIAVSPSGIFMVTGLNPGSNTFTMKYRSADAADTAEFANRSILVLPY